MNDIDKLPNVCCDCENLVEKRERNAGTARIGNEPQNRSDYILRSDAVEAMMTCRSLTGVAKLEAVNHIMPIPAADVEMKRKTGVWIRCGEPDGDRNIRFECSVCHAGDVHAEGMDVPYCWKCGSEMHGEMRGEEE